MCLMINKKRTHQEMILEYCKMRGKVNIDMPTYYGSMNPEDMIDFVREIERYFYIEHLEDPKRVKVSCLKLKDLSSLWCDNGKDKKVKKGKEKVNTWEIMATDLNDKFLPTNYTISLFKKLQNLQPKVRTVK